MKMYYLEESIDNLLEESCDTREEAQKAIDMYFQGFTKDELLELLIRGQIHAHNDKRTNGYFDR